MSVREATLNVPCTGEFKVYVRPDGGWTIYLKHNDGNNYMRFSGATFEGNTFIDPYDVRKYVEIPDWMFAAVQDKVHELQYAVERDSIVTPHTVNEYVQ